MSHVFTTARGLIKIALNWRRPIQSRIAASDKWQKSRKRGGRRDEERA